MILNLMNWILHPTFSLKSLLWSRGNNHTWVVTYFVEKDSVLSHVLGQSEYCHPPWSLAVQFVEHLCTCYAKSPMNTKPVYVLPGWPWFISATADLNLLRQISIVRLLLKKRNNLVEVSWPMVHWVIDKGIFCENDIHSCVECDFSDIYISTATQLSYIVTRLITYRNNPY
jgi:hypothetical protein